MNKLHSTLTAIPVLILTINFTVANAQESYPMADRVAEKVISHYQTSSCEQLKMQKMQAPSERHDPMEQKAVQLLRDDPKLRMHFLNKVAGPIANKMFECGMIP